MVNLPFASRSDSGHTKDNALILWFEEVGIADIPYVGGKNASLGEMIQQLMPKGVSVPTGFATTAYAFRYFIEKAGLKEQLRSLFSDLDVENMPNLRERGQQARGLILNTPFPKDLALKEKNGKPADATAAM
jgi:pyruvate,water dikinase